MALYVDTAAAQFENVNSLRSYPFSDGCRLVDRGGSVLTNDAVVDVRIFAPASHDGERPSVKMTSFHMSGSMVSVCFSSESESGKCALAAIVSAEDFRPYFPYRLEKLAGTLDAGGVVTFGNIEFPGFPKTYFFDDATVHPCCVVLSRPAGLRSIFDPRSGESLNGDVEMSFSGHVVSERKGKSFSLKIEDDSRSQLSSECRPGPGVGVCGATPIRSINGVAPDDDGNIVLWFH